jgi:hypothetical protein
MLIHYFVKTNHLKKQTELLKWKYTLSVSKLLLIINPMKYTYAMFHGSGPNTLKNVKGFIVPAPT